MWVFNWQKPKLSRARVFGHQHEERRTLNECGNEVHTEEARFRSWMCILQTAWGMYRVILEKGHSWAESTSQIGSSPTMPLMDFRPCGCHALSMTWVWPWPGLWSYGIRARSDHWDHQLHLSQSSGTFLFHPLLLLHTHISRASEHHGVASMDS